MDEDDDVFPAPAPYQVPRDATKIKERIRRYERALQAERRREGDYRDGSGKRFLLGPLYLILGDLAGALKSFAWFEATFPDSTDEAPHVLCWSLALHRAGQEAKAQRMLRRTMLANLYILPRLLGLEVRRHDIWHGCNTAEPSYLSWVPAEYWALWSDAERRWAAELWQSEEFRNARERYIEQGHALKSLPPGAERNRVVDKIRRLEAE